MTESGKSLGLSVRHFGADDSHLWTTTNLGELFQQGYVAAGSRQAMLRLAVSLKCIDVLSRDFARTPMYLFEWMKGGAKIVDPSDHRVAKMLATRTSRYYGTKEFKRIAASYLATASQYYVAARRNGKDDLLEVQGIPHTDVNIRVEPKQRRYVYDVTANGLHAEAQYGWAQRRGGLLDTEMAHIRLRSMNGYDAIATSNVARAAFDLLNHMNKFQTDLFNNGGMPILGITFPEGMTDEQWERLNKELTAQAKKSREKGVPFILEGANGEVPKVEKMSLTAVDTEFLKANTAAMMDICRFYGVPPHKAYVFDSVKYDNLDSIERLYVDDSLVPLFDAFCEALQPVLLTEEEQEKYFVGFDKEAAYASDPLQRQKVIESRWKNGQIEYDEMREAIGYNAAGGKLGRQRMFSGNFVVVDEKGEVVLKAGGNAPGDDDKADDEKPAPKKNLRLVQ
jgi:HK97 family phage portal protein